ncbi:SANT/Myb-like DNA-binding domain-containing protein [Aspergillus alliaceus]|uniref:SANT/Myb-like DNA-binding domain-containing protein n=1 Tax=Petromyces alliaceus TaxID=209559 RepID=UPI0012A3C1D7|nr:uncharacterized protein BDW43DRAFT_308252 [Aspergillus alliaceus]KAB8236577.1 hypothetical protein BDW43DRAFT_308252 [Aspergillus alliaceus]
MDAVEATTKPSQQNVIRNGKWLPAEDARLREAVAAHGTRWIIVASVVGTRNGDQCAKRWNENLNPELDHSPWTPEEDACLLDLVEVYGHNWKFMANYFLEARAPSALKNRYSLLMRRLKRQGNGQDQAVNAGRGRGSRSTARPRVFSRSPSPFPMSPVDPTNVLVGGDPPHSHPLDLMPTSAAVGTFPPLTFGATDAMGNVGLQGPVDTVSETAIATLGDTDLVWRQPPWLGDGMELDGGILSTGTEGEPNSLIAMLVSDDFADGQDAKSTACKGNLHYATSSVSEDSSGVSVAASVEYSVTCQRGRARSLVNQLVDAAMSECLDRTSEEDKVTLTLQVKV